MHLEKLSLLIQGDIMGLLMMDCRRSRSKDLHNINHKHGNSKNLQQGILTADVEYNIVRIK